MTRKYICTYAATMVFAFSSAFRAFGDAAPTSITVPIKVVNSKIIVDVMIDGHGPHSLGIDSGAETVMLSQKVVDADKMATTSGTIELAGTDGAYKPVSQTTIGKLTIGTFEVDNPVTTVAPSDISVDGYIGAPLFNTYTVQIDFGNNTLSLFTPDSFKPTPEDQEIVIMLGKHRYPVLKGEIGGFEANLQVDSGSAFPAELLPNFAAAHDVTKNFVKIGSVESKSVGGPMSSDVYDLKSLWLGSDHSLQYNGVLPTLVLPTDSTDTQFDGRIGEPMLASFVVTFDYAHSKMYLRKSTPAATSTPSTPAVASPSTTSVPAPTQPNSPSADQSK